MRSLILATLSLFLTLPVYAADVTLQLPAGDGFVVEDNTGTVERLRVDEATGNISRNGALFVHTTGPSNTFIGEGAGNTATTGFFNSAVGKDALRSNTTGISNVALGSAAGFNQTTGSNNIYLANARVAAESGMIKNGNAAHTATYIEGINGVTLPGAGSAVYVDASNQLGTAVSSSLRTKTDVVDMGDATTCSKRCAPCASATGGTGWGRSRLGSCITASWPRRWPQSPRTS